MMSFVKGELPRCQGGRPRQLPPEVPLLFASPFGSFEACECSRTLVPNPAWCAGVREPSFYLRLSWPIEGTPCIDSPSRAMPTCTYSRRDTIAASQRLRLLGSRSVAIPKGNGPPGIALPAGRSNAWPLSGLPLCWQLVGQSSRQRSPGQSVRGFIISLLTF